MNMDSKSIKEGSDAIPPSDSKKTIAAIVIFILIAVNGLLLWQFFSKKKSLEIVSVNLETAISEKDELSAELEQMKADYQKVSKENESLKEELSAKDAEIQLKMEEIEKLINSGDAAKLKRARKELKSLKELNQVYVAQIDSLNTVNVELNVKNSKLNKSLVAEQGRVQKLTNENSLLANKVAIGAALNTTNMTAVGVKFKKSGKEVESKKASSVKKIKTCCTVMKNLITTPGLKKTYLRVLSPDGAVMSTSSETFMYNNRATLYTLKDFFEYNNENTQLCLYWSKGSQYSKGEYKIEIYCEGNLIGSTKLTFK
jgi:predicted nuclease with TOPRIM domain